ncbi:MULTISPECIES: hypothetical protein [Candidatus Cardinium]|uniref:hypothetical protein n=1 Tax=Candidatus Cardinium TaxID=273135 RepID=UPI001FAA70FF|nr:MULTISPECIES: hypothetical protein [Cardinium]
MKWKFRLSRKASLRLISLLPMVMGVSCKRNAPRYEPVFLGYDVDAPNAQSPIRDPNLIQTPNGAKPCDPHLQHLYYYYKVLEDDLTDMLKKIGCSSLLSQLRLSQLDYSKRLAEEILLLNIVPDPEHVANDFSALVDASQAALGHAGSEQASRLTSNQLPNRLGIFFDARESKELSWGARKLVGVASIAVSANPLLANSEKHRFALTAFLLVYSNKKNKDAYKQFVACSKAGQQWCYYNNGQTATLSNQQAIDLASKYGIIFFYQKIAR